MSRLLTRLADRLPGVADRVRKRLRPVGLLVGLAALALSGAACKQGAGDRCEVDTDCKSGLTCLGGTGSTNPEGGRCGSTPTATPPVDGSIIDTGGTTPDVGPDLAPATDGGDAQDDSAAGDAGDAGPGTDAMDDGAPADAAGSDASID